MKILSKMVVQSDIFKFVLNSLWVVQYSHQYHLCLNTRCIRNFLSGLFQKQGGSETFCIMSRIVRWKWVRWKGAFQTVRKRQPKSRCTKVLPLAWKWLVFWIISYMKQEMKMEICEGSFEDNVAGKRLRERLLMDSVASSIKLVAVEIPEQHSPGEWMNHQWHFIYGDLVIPQ